MGRLRRIVAVPGVLVLALLGSGCAAVLGIDEPEARGWTFDRSVEAWDIVVWNGDSAAELEGLDMGYQDDEGSPDLGALQLDIPFEIAGEDQASFGIDLDAADDRLNLADKTLRAQIKIQAEDLSSFAAYAVLYVQTGGYCDAQPESTASRNYRTEEWLDLSVDASEWLPTADCADDFDLEDVSQVGFRIGSQEEVPTRVFVDSVTY